MINKIVRKSKIDTKAIALKQNISIFITDTLFEELYSIQKDLIIAEAERLKESSKSLPDDFYRGEALGMAADFLGNPTFYLSGGETNVGGDLLYDHIFKMNQDNAANIHDFAGAGDNSNPYWCKLKLVSVGLNLDPIVISLEFLDPDENVFSEDIKMDLDESEHIVIGRYNYYPTNISILKNTVTITLDAKD